MTPPVPSRGCHGGRWHAAVVSLFLLVATPAPTLAHDPGLSAMTVELGRDRWTVHVVIARREVEPLVAMDTDGDGTVSAAELAVARPRLHALATAAVVLDTEGGLAAVDEVAADVDGSDAVHLRLAVVAPARAHARVRVPLIARLALGHRQYVRIRDDQGRLLAEHVLHTDAPAFTVSLDVAAATRRRPDFRAFVLLGIEHIATGYDHLLFLLALLVVAPGLRTTASIITSFTVAHSITLALATFDVVRLAPAVVEPLIAGSVLYVGVENLRARPLAPRWMATFGFGLVHGLGFATALRDLGVGDAGKTAALPLLGFNLGVEVGQLAVAAIVVPLVWCAQHRPRLFTRVATASSMLVAVAGAAWLLRRTVLE